MSIDWTHFTPLSAVAGGALIGASASLLLALNGRIAGISGIVGGLLRFPRGDLAWRIAFVAGLAAAGPVYRLFAVPPASGVTHSIPTLMLAGLLVGLGSRYGAGCTSGHGVCGLARLSPRSLAATLGFMVVGFLTVYLVRHVLASSVGAAS